jgi:hypothetical protein
MPVRWLIAVMVGATVKLLPQEKATNVRAGAALLLVGLLVVFWSFSGSQAYDIKFFYLALVGAILAVYGSVLLANSRVVSERHRRIRAAQRAAAPREWVRLECPTCRTVFEAEGERPFTAICPNCASSGLLE